VTSRVRKGWRGTAFLGFVKAASRGRPLAARIPKHQRAKNFETFFPDYP